MISKPVQGICHPRVGIAICLFAGSKKGIHHGKLLCPQLEPTNKKFFLPSVGGLILLSMALLSRWLLQTSKKGSIR